MQHSELHFFTPNSDQALSLPKGMAWMTGEKYHLLNRFILSRIACLYPPGPGIYHGTLNFDSTSDELIDAAQLLPYPSLPSSSSSPGGHEDTVIPASIALTEFHFILLYKDRIAAVCNLDEKMTYEEQLPMVNHFFLVIRVFHLTSLQKPTEEVRGLAADPVRKTYWVYTDQSLFELQVGNEDRDVWKIYLEKGKFDVALRYAKV